VRLVRRYVALVGSVLVLAVVAWVGWPHLRAYTGTAPPAQIDQPLNPAPIGAGVVGVAHNAGNNPTTVRAGLDNGAQVIEIDVILARGELAAGRAHAWSWLAERVFRGPTLVRAWDQAGSAAVVKLDLQQNDRPLLEALAGFLHSHPRSGPVWVSTRDPAAIRYLGPHLPGSVTLMLSLPFPAAVTQLRSDTSLQREIGGISVFRELVTPALVRWAHEQGLLVLAWTVNDGEQLSHVLRAGVDGVTTANLAVLRHLATGSL